MLALFLSLSLLVLFADIFFQHIPLRLKLLSKHCYQNMNKSLPTSFVLKTHQITYHIRCLLKCFSSNTEKWMEKKHRTNRFCLFIFGLAACHPSTYCTFQQKHPAKRFNSLVISVGIFGCARQLVYMCVVIFCFLFFCALPWCVRTINGYIT